MAEDTWINVTFDSGLRAHTSSRKGSAAGDATLVYDSAKITTLAALRTVLDHIYLNCQAAGMK